jgi:hypothetical protein
MPVCPGLAAEDHISATQICEKVEQVIHSRDLKILEVHFNFPLANGCADAAEQINALFAGLI